MLRCSRALLGTLFVLTGCAAEYVKEGTPDYSAPRAPAQKQPATAANLDAYGRPTDPGARACYDKCMRTYDNVDALGDLVGTSTGPTFKNDNRQQAHCYDKCAPAEKPKVCQTGEIRSCSCPDPNDFSAEPLPGTRSCLPNRTAFGGCDCTASAAPAEPTPATNPIPPPAAPQPTFEASCKAAIKSHCEAVCAESPAAERGPCEVSCMRKPIAEYDGTLKECSPDLAGY